MSAVYTILASVPLNYFDPALQEAVPSHQVTARWSSTGSVIRVTIPDTAYNATEVDSRIRQAGYAEDQVFALGSGAAAPPPAASSK